MTKGFRFYFLKVQTLADQSFILTRFVSLKVAGYRADRKQSEIGLLTAVFGFLRNKRYSK